MTNKVSDTDRNSRLITAALSSSELKDRLKIYCVLNKVLMKDAIEQAIVDFLDKNDKREKTQ